jgi:hypothetical protein
MSPLIELIGGAKSYGWAQYSEPFPVTGAYDSIATIIVPSIGAPGVVSFVGIPQTYTHLQVRIIVQGTTSFNVPFLGLGINSSVSNIYGTHRIVADGSTVVAAATANSSQMIFPRFPDTATPSYTNMFGAMIIDYLDYTGGNKNPTVRGYGGYDANGSGQIGLASGFQLSTDAIKSLEFNTVGLAQNSSFALYGIKGA